MSDDIERDYDSPAADAFVKAFVARAKPTPTPTPPDAVREALVGALMYGLLERDHTLANVLRVHVSENVGLIRSAEQMADALLTRPSDARGREERIEYAVRQRKPVGRSSDGWYHRGPLVWQGVENVLASLSPNGCANAEIVYRTVTTTDWRVTTKELATPPAGGRDGE